MAVVYRVVTMENLLLSILAIYVYVTVHLQVEVLTFWSRGFVVGEFVPNSVRNWTEMQHKGPSPFSLRTTLFIVVVSLQIPGNILGQVVNPCLGFWPVRGFSLIFKDGLCDCLFKIRGGRLGCRWLAQRMTSACSVLCDVQVLCFSSDWQAKSMPRHPPYMHVYLIRLCSHSNQRLSYVGWHFSALRLTASNLCNYWVNSLGSLMAWISTKTSTGTFLGDQKACRHSTVLLLSTVLPITTTGVY